MKRRIGNALWGLFIADALSMPVHWFYDRENIVKEYGDWIGGYEAPKHPHPESFMVGMKYFPDIESANRLNRPYNILHQHSRFYRTNFSDFQMSRGEREEQHGNEVPSLDERYHYHHGLKKGENTLGAQLVRVLLRSVAAHGEYSPRRFLDDFISHLTFPGKNRDPYTEIYIRRWFENYTHGRDIFSCAENQRENWSIGSHGGLVRPMAVSLLTPGNSYSGFGLAMEHQNLTHRSENVAAALHVLVPLLHELISGAPFIETLGKYAVRLRYPEISGEALFSLYREHNGPGNIPKDRMWRVHTRMSEKPFDLIDLAMTEKEEEVVKKTFATACYPEHGVPLLLYQAYIHEGDFEKTLLANTNAGGDNVHRGMVLGMILGAAQEEIPGHLVEGLLEHEEIGREIEAFLQVL